MRIFGYGTFITKKFYLFYQDIRPAFLPNHYRVMEPNGVFPFVVKSEKSHSYNSGFWGLTFEANPEQVKKLDCYEGVGSLYERIEEFCLYADGTENRVFLYYPSNEIIIQKRLEDLIEAGDLWFEKMKENFPEILNEYPDLTRKDNPRI